MHSLVLVVYDQYMRRNANGRKRNCTSGSEPEPGLKQTKLPVTAPSIPVVTQTKFDSLLTYLVVKVVKEMLSLTFVEQTVFEAFVKGTF